MLPDMQTQQEALPAICQEGARDLHALSQLQQVS